MKPEEIVLILQKEVSSLYEAIDMNERQNRHYEQQIKLKEATIEYLENFITPKPLG